MKRSIALILVLLTVFSLISACGKAPASTQPDTPADTTDNTDKTPEAQGSDKPFTIGLSMYTLEYPFYVTMHDAFIEAAEAKGWSVIVTNANTDVNVQLNDCMDMLNKSIDALAFTSWYGDALADVFDICEQKNIPVFMMDTSTYPEGAKFVTKIGTVNYDGGVVGGTWAGKYLVKNSITTVDVVGLHSGDQVSVDRFNGLIDGIKALGVNVNILNEYHSKSREESMANAEDALTTYSKIDLFVCTSAQHGMGAYGAAMAAGRDEMKIVAYDGEKEEMDEIDKGGIYLMTVMQLPADMSRTIVAQIEDYLTNGKAPEQIQSSPAGVYSPDGTMTAAEVDAL